MVLVILADGGGCLMQAHIEVDQTTDIVREIGICKQSRTNENSETI